MKLRGMASGIVTMALIVILCVQFFGKPYGKELKFKAGQLFYTEAVSENEAKKLGEYLVQETFFDDTPKTVQLNKSGERFELRLVVKRDFQNDPDYLGTLELMTGQVSLAVFADAPVDIHVCDDKFKTMREVNFVSLGKELKFKAGQLYYVAPVTEAEAKKLGEYLVEKTFFDDTPRTVQLHKADKTYQFRMVVKKGLENDQEYLKNIASFGKEVSRDVFQNAPVVVQLCDNKLKTMKEVGP